MRNAGRCFARAKWIATAPFNGTAGFHLNEIYSPWVKLGDMARGFLDAKRSPETLKTWINTSLGESWEEDSERVDGHALMARLEDWGQAAPSTVLAITCGVDVQDDRLEIERIGWGVDEESWSLDHRILYGDPSGPELWGELDDYLLTPTEKSDGTFLPVHAVAIDSGGHHTAAVHKFCKDRFRRRVYAIKGLGGPGKPIWPKRASKNNKARINQFMIGVDAGKDAVYARLKIREPGPGFCHFPKGREPGYFEQLTAEVVQTRYIKGFPSRVYVLPGGRRNEALDIRVYGYAALQSLNVRWGNLMAAQSRPPPRPTKTEQIEAAPASPAGVSNSRPKRSGWVERRGGWLR
jgi:phage terminase large subunit GpA-like protein